MQMRTTLNIEDRLYERAKRIATTGGRTVSSLIEEGLRIVLAPHDEPAERNPVRVTVVGGRGLQPGVDLDDSAALHDLTER